MKLLQWYGQREAQAAKHKEWHGRLGLLGILLRRYAETLQPDPVTKLPIITVTDLRGPQDWIVGYRVDVLDDVASLVIRLRDDLEAVDVINGVEDFYPGMTILNIVATEGDDAELHFTTGKLLGKPYQGSTLTRFMTEYLEHRLR
jgi:hypothetical protein